MKSLLTIVSFIFCLNLALAQEKPQVVPGNIIVQMAEKSVDEVIAANQYFEGVETNLKLNRLLSAPMAAYLLEFNPSIHHDRFLQQLWNHSAVTLIQLNHYVQNRITTPDDPQLDQQWWHVNDGSGGGTADADIDSDEAWDITTGGVTATGDTIVVCIVDDGGDFEHPDLAANMWYNYNEIPNNNIDDDNNGYVDDFLGWNPVDNNDNVDGGGHGVNVAGMVGAVGDNGTGVVGVNWNVKIMTMTYGNINQEANVVEAYTYPLIMRRLYESSNGALGAYVVATNSSWGINNGDPADAPIWCAFYDTLGTSGILSAGATANSNVNIDNVGDLPTACPSEYMIAVTATNNSDVRTFSGYGQTTIDIGAPGEDVRTTAAGGGYTTTSGTSFATPATAGAIALIYSAPCASLAAISHADPALAARMVRDAIFNGVDPVSNLATECVTGGRLNLKGALDEILSSCSNGGCMPPFSLGAGNVTDTEASLVWSSLVAIDSFNISYGLDGEAATAVLDVNTNNYDLNGLTPCSDYWFIGQSICDGVTSDWSDTLFFSTDGCCEAPEGLATTNVTETGGNASWNAVLAANSYELQWRPTGNGNWTTESAISGTSFSISGLDGCTEYEVQVASNCDGGTTDFSASTTFMTFGCGSCTDETFCESNGSNTQEWIANVTVDGLNNTSNNDADGYGDYTNQSIDLQRGQTYNVSFTPAYPDQQWTEHFRLWIDLNQSGTFANAEMLFDDDQGTTSTITGTIEIPLTAELGSARMRVSMAYGGQFGGGYPQAPCDEGQDGEVEDYCVNIIVEDPDGITEKNNSFGMEIYPTPATDVVTVDLQETFSGTVYLSILDITGKVILTDKTTSSRNVINISTLADGMYMLRARNKSNELIGQGKIMKY